MTNKYGDIRFLHFADDLRDVPLDGGITVAYQIVGDAILYAVSYCSPNDRFIKKYGCNRSAGLLRQLRASKPLLSDTFEDTRSGYVIGTVADLARFFETNASCSPRKEKARA